MWPREAPRKHLQLASQVRGAWALARAGRTDTMPRKQGSTDRFQVRGNMTDGKRPGFAVCERFKCPLLVASPPEPGGNRC